MCGFSGIVSKSLNNLEREEAISKMAPYIAARGPDEKRYVHYQDGSFEFARLSIRSVSNGSQPILHKSRGTLSMTNGEVYNDKYIRSKYSRSEWQTESDCECIHSIYDSAIQFEDAIPDVSGMFASAIYDTKSGTVTLARDRTGQKPLFFALCENHTLIFSSSLRSIIASGLTGLRIRKDQLAFSLFNEYSEPGKTLVEGIYSVKPGEVVEWNIGSFHIKRKAYWSWNIARCEYESRPTYEPLKQKLKEILLSAISEELVADVPIGLFLSGGIDSSLLLALGSQLTHKKISTFSVSFKNNLLDESSFAKRLAQKFNTDHHEIPFDSYDTEDLILEAMSSLDIPLGDSSYIPTFLLSKVASGYVKCALGGDGGDELFGGYPTYKAHRILSLYESFVPQFTRGMILGRLSRRLPVETTNINTKMKIDRFMAGRTMPFAHRHITWMSTTYDIKRILEIIGDEFSVESDLFGSVESRLQASGIQDAVNAAQYIDLIGYLPGSIHSKVDCASMNNGLEVRSPYVNRVLLDAAESIIPDYRVGINKSKIILRDIAKECIPSSIANAPKKGFNFPAGQFLATTLKDSFYDRIRNFDGIINRSIIESSYEEHCKGTHDHRKLLWTIYSMASWYQNAKEAAMLEPSRKLPFESISN